MTRLQHLQLAELQFQRGERWWQHSPAHPGPAPDSDSARLSPHRPQHRHPGCSWGHLRPLQSTRTGLTRACSPLVRGCVCSTHNPHHKDILSSPTGDCTDRPGNKQLQRTNKRSHGCLFLGSSKVEIPAEAFPAHGIFFASSSLFQILLPTAEPGCTLSLRGYQMGNFLRFSIFSSLELLMLSSLAEMFWKWGGLG